MEKWPVFNQNHGLSPLEKSQFFDLLNFFFLSFMNIVQHIVLAYIFYKKNMEKWPFLNQNHRL